MYTMLPQLYSCQKHVKSKLIIRKQFQSVRHPIRWQTWTLQKIQFHKKWKMEEDSSTLKRLLNHRNQIHLVFEKVPKIYHIQNLLPISIPPKPRQVCKVSPIAVNRDSDLSNVQPLLSFPGQWSLCAFNPFTYTKVFHYNVSKLHAEVLTLRWFFFSFSFQEIKKYLKQYLWAQMYYN